MYCHESIGTTTESIPSKDEEKNEENKNIYAHPAKGLNKLHTLHPLTFEKEQQKKILCVCIIISDEKFLKKRQQATHF